MIAEERQRHTLRSWRLRYSIREYRDSMPCFLQISQTKPLAFFPVEVEAEGTFVAGGNSRNSGQVSKKSRERREITESKTEALVGRVREIVGGSSATFVAGHNESGQSRIRARVEIEWGAQRNPNSD